MLDIVRLVPQEKGESDKRDVSLPIWDDRYAWWTVAVKEKLGGTDQKDLAAKLGFSESKVSRAISRSKPLFDAVIAISDELGVPRPVFLPESAAEATQLALISKLFQSDRQLEQVHASARKTDEPLKSKRRAPRRITKQK